MEAAIQIDINDRSQFINGQEESFRAAAEVCLSDSTLDHFWRMLIKAIRNHVRGDVGGRIFTSNELDVYLGPWDVAIKHHYAWIDQEGGDSYMGFCEGYADLKEDFEVIAVYDPETDQNLPDLVMILNRYYEEHENKK